MVHLFGVSLNFYKAGDTLWFHYVSTLSNHYGTLCNHYVLLKYYLSLLEFIFLSIILKDYLKYLIRKYSKVVPSGIS